MVSRVLGRECVVSRVARWVLGVGRCVCVVGRGVLRTGDGGGEVAVA